MYIVIPTSTIFYEIGNRVSFFSRNDTDVIANSYYQIFKYGDVNISNEHKEDSTSPHAKIIFFLFYFFLSG